MVSSNNLKTMKRNRNTSGQYLPGEAKELISFRVPADLKEKLSKFPNRSKYIESLLYEKMTHMQIADPEWDYHPQWESLFEIIIMAGRAIEKLAQYEEQCEDADAIWLEAIKEIGNWKEMQEEALRSEDNLS